MKKLLILLLFISSQLSMADNIKHSEKLFDLAESSFPEFFSPIGAKTYQLNNFLVRYYEDSKTFMGTQGEYFYVYGDIFGGFLKVGKIAEFIDTDDTDQTPSRGLQWVKNNPMFISGLSVSLKNPPGDFVDSYFDDFNATAAHLWADGLPWQIDDWAAVKNNKFRYVSWLYDDGTSLSNREVLGGTPANASGRIGYQIGDEPGIGCDTLECAMTSIKAMQEGVDTVRAVDPDALIFLNFEMSDYTEDLLTYYGAQMDGDIISYDYYSQDSGAYKALETFRSAGLRYNKPYWRYIKSFYFDDGSHSSLSESDLRWDAFSGLVYGYTGHTWFTYNTHIHPQINPALFDWEEDFNAPTTELWSIAAQINKEMQNLGRAITQLTSTDVRYIPRLKILQPKKTSNWSFGAGNDAYIVNIKPADDFALLDISVGFFKDDKGENYFMLQNVSHKHGDEPVKWGGDEEIRIAFDFKGAPDNVNRNSLLSLNKVSGKIEVLPMSSVNGDEAYIDIKLAAGDPVLLKYDNGAAFALQQ